MEYRYKKNQIFRKKLNAPKYIINKVYNCDLSFSEMIEYKLDDKIPSECLLVSDRKLVQRFGLERCKGLDWELINGRIRSDISIRDILMSIDPEVEDINETLYELVKDKIRPSNYSPKMKEKYSDRFFDMSKEEVPDAFSHLAFKFNEGNCSLDEMIRWFPLFENKDISLCLMNDKENTFGLTSDDVKSFVSEFGILLPYMLKDIDIYTLIAGYKDLESEEDRRFFIKVHTDRILKKTYRSSDESRSKNLLVLPDDVYEEIFKYSSLEDYLTIFSEWDAPKIMKELEGLPEGYIFNIPIPFSILRKYDVLRFIGEFGLKNVVDFDNECGHFFTADDCRMLKLMNDMYLHYASNEHNPKRNIYDPRKTIYDDEGRYVGSYYTKDGFYEAMRRMIVYGPTDWNYVDKAPDYRNMTGEFRIRNFGLFIDDNAPEELKKLFYTKSLTPKLIIEHPEYIPYLEGKDLSSCFINVECYVENKRGIQNFENIYSFISSKVDYEKTMNFIVQYSDVFDIIFAWENTDYRHGVVFLESDSLEVMEEKICDALKKIIIEKNWVYPKNIPNKLKERYPNLFLSDDAPEELKEALYNRTLTTEFILSNSEYINYLRNVDIEVVFKSMNVSVNNGRFNSGENLISFLKGIFGDETLDVMLLYGKFIEKTYETDKLKNLRFNINCTKDECLDAIDRAIYQTIINEKMKYDDTIASHFKNNYPMLFLDENVSADIRKKFYNREFTLSDFNENPDLIDIFGMTNVVCGFSEELSWMIPLFNNEENPALANYNRLKAISAFLKIEDIALQNAFKEFILSSDEELDMEKVEYAAEVLKRLSISNSSEIFTFRKELAVQILKADNPLETLGKIEDLFVRSHIPTVGKIYACFDILHPDFRGIDFTSSKMSPMLSSTSTRGKKILVFSDLIKASFGSNNRSVNAYLDNIEFGSNLYDGIKSGKVDFDSLSSDDKERLVIFTKHLATLYNNTLDAVINNDIFICSDDVLNDLLVLSQKLSVDGNLDYNLGDRVVRMFCGFTGISTVEDAKKYINSKRENADRRNRIAAESDMVLEEGDFVKGIGDITYLRNILQNGSVAKEFLGASASSDTTPLDTDLSRIMINEGSVSDKINSTAASNYGPIWFVLKNDDRFVTTRTTEGLTDVDRSRDKLEVFHTGTLGGGHYGIRTGFASSEINYIIMNKFDPRVGLEIAMNGFYIPVVNNEGKIIFTPEDFDNLRDKMSGLSYFGEDDYHFSSELVTDDVLEIASQIEESNREVQEKRERINALIKEALDELGLKLKTEIDGDLSEGFVELIDTGSTGRGTNKPGDGDFDMMMRLDRTILSNPSKLIELKKILLKKLGRDNMEGVIGTGDFRLKDVALDEDTLVDIDITFTEKTDKVLYSTDMALQERLETIREQDPEKYNLVVANILLAKQVLKDAGVYKPNRGENPQGGLGGVGVENWILQNGGSFIEAARSFVEAAQGKSFDEFKESYQVWDFGDNHLAERRNQYAHDNFITSNMSEEGFHKMCEVLSGYLKKVDKTNVDTDTKKV